MNNIDLYKFVKKVGIKEFDERTGSILLNNNKAYSLNENFLNKFKIKNNNIYKKGMIG